MVKAWHRVATLGVRIWGKCPLSLRRILLGIYFERPDARMRPSAKRSVFFLPLISWYYAGFQRPHQMARALSEIGCTIFYHEPVTPGDFDIRPERERRRRIGLEKIMPRLSLVRFPRFAVPDVISFLSVDVVVMSWPDQRRWFDEQSSALLVYEMVDDHSLLGGSDPSHARLIQIADVVVASADILLRSIKPLRDDVMLLPNGVKLEDWVVPSESAPPPDLGEACQKDVVIGYTGALASWFDWDLLEAMAQIRPNWAFVLIGFTWDEQGNARAQKAASLSNVYWLGPKPHSQLKHYVSCFNVAIIPFLLNAVTHSCSPLKLFEYMACGKPIVCTPMHEVSKYRSLRTASSPAEFVAQIEKAIETDDDEAVAARRNEAAENTWTARATALLEHVEKVWKEQNGQPRRHRLCFPRASS